MSRPIRRHWFGSIMLQGVDAERSTDGARVYLCGCTSAGRWDAGPWYLCEHHAGYDAASDAGLRRRADAAEVTA